MKPDHPIPINIKDKTIRPPFYFLSDIHLSTRRDAAPLLRREKIMSLLRDISASGGTLFILGDFFDFWFDRRGHVPKTLQPVVNALALLCEKNIGIHYIGGNHDYWIEGYLTRELGIHFYPEDITFSYENIRFYCQHGDRIVYNNFVYPLVRRIIRAPLAIALLKCLPVRWTYALGEKVSHYNRSAEGIPRVTERITQKMQHFLLEKLDEGYDIAISGHVHKPLCVQKDSKYAVILGDWIHHCSYGIWDGSAFRLVHDTW